MARLGKWSLLAGLAIAVLGGLYVTEPWFGWVLVVLGLVAGFLAGGAGSRRRFLLAAIALLVAANAAGGLHYVSGALSAVLANVIALLAAAVLVAGVRSLFAADSAR